jgi:hypothetical protein
VTTVEQVDQQWAGYEQRILTAEMLGSRIVLSADTVPGYMDWYLQISHPYIIPIPEGHFVRPVQIDAVVQEAQIQSQSQAQSQTQISSPLADRLSHIRDILKELMSSDEIANNSCVYQRLKDAEELTMRLTYVMRGRSDSAS